MEFGILSVGERMKPTLPGVEEAASPSVTGHDVVAVDRRRSNRRRADLAPFFAEEPTMTLGNADAPYCILCGVQMQRAGSCHACPSCGSTSGCS